jgi:hypothetical protein
LFEIVKRIVGRQGAIPVTRRAVGRYRHQHRALAAGGTRRPSRC